MKYKKFSIHILILLILSTALVAWRNISIVNGQEDDAFNAEIKALNQQIQTQKQQLESLANKQKQYAQQIAAKQQEKNTLSSQLSLLADKAAQTELEIESTNISINKTNLEAQKISLDIIDTNATIEAQKDRIAKLLRLVYKQDQVYSLEVLLLNDSISEFLNHAKYLENANNELRQNLNQLQYDKERLDQAKINIDNKNK